MSSALGCGEAGRRGVSISSSCSFALLADIDVDLIQRLQPEINIGFNVPHGAIGPKLLVPLRQPVQLGIQKRIQELLCAAHFPLILEIGPLSLIVQCDAAPLFEKVDAALADAQTKSFCLGGGE